ncbi:Peptidase-S8 domain-containing protein [Fusarium keratoplasticum]|nr:Peptidase-S8 domain-containing protein [Fusarium keratoplasticum]
MRVIAVFALVAGASTFLAPWTPTKAPYHVPEGFKLAADEYLVMLHDNHTIDDHITNTGLNLTERVISFNPFNVINAYHLSVREEYSAFIHEIIRHDPGVAYVHHNYYNKEEIPEILGDVVKRDFIPDDPSMDKRWNKQTRKCWTTWNMAMISGGWMQRTSEPAGVPHERERRDFGTDLDKAHEAIWKYHPGPGVNIYVFDTGIKLSHSIFSKYTGLEKKARTSRLSVPRLDHGSMSAEGECAAGPSGIPIRRGRTRRQEQDGGNYPDLPKQQVESHPDSDRWMIDVDMSGYKHPEPDSSACFGLQTNRYLNRDVLVGNIEHFYEAAQARARRDPGSKFISTIYTPNEVMLIIDYETPDIDYEIVQEDCVFYLKHIVLDRCDSSSKDNPGNWKAGGVAHKDKIRYLTEPLKQRNSWAGCKVDGRNVHVWGGGWSTTDSGKRLIEEAKNCGIDAGSPKFNYGGGDDNREWTAEMNEGSDVDNKCISEAIEKAGGPKVICEKTAPPPPPPKPFEPKYDCQGSGLCGGPLLQVKHCDYAVNRLRRNRADPTWYGTQQAQDISVRHPETTLIILNREGRLTGNCWAKSDGIGCGVFIEGSGCELIGDDIWEYYQKIRSSCKKCGKVEYKAGCFVKIDYVAGCNNHDWRAKASHG